MTGLSRHGGRLAEALRAFPQAPTPWLDLSTGINPHPWRGRRADAAALQRLPDPEDLARLEAVAAAAFGVAPECVAAVAGAEAGLRLMPQLTGARSAAIVSPTYGGHAAAWTAAGVEVTPIAPGAETTAEALIVVNPNNPDGAVRDPAALAREDRWLIVDESFVDATPQISVAAAGLPRTIVLRSFGKFYGLAGVRLGFVVATPTVAARVRDLVGDWPVSAEAIALGTGAYAEPAWAQRTRLRLARDARRLDRVLIAAGFEIVGGTALFRLARAADATRRFEALAHAGVLARPFDHDRTLLRFGLPGHGDWGRLQTALEGLG